MQVNGFGDAVKTVMETETKKRKIIIAVLNGTILVAALIIGGFFLA